MMSLQIVFVAIAFIVWMLKIRSRKNELSMGYGFILIFPVSIMRESKFIMQAVGRLLGWMWLFVLIKIFLKWGFIVERINIC